MAARANAAEVLVDCLNRRKTAESFLWCLDRAERTRRRRREAKTGVTASPC